MIWLLLAAIGIGLSLGIFGSGGSVLTLPVLVYLAAQEPKQAISGALLVVALISLASLLPKHTREQIAWQKALQLGLPGLAGAYLGVWLSTYLSGTAQLILFAILMLGASLNMWRGAKENIPVAKVDSHLAIYPIGLLVGLLTGLTGVGGGFLLLPALMRFADLSFFRARATSLLLIAANALLGFVKSWALLPMPLDWSLLTLIAATGIVGSLTGQFVTKNWPVARLRKGFALFLLLLAIAIILNNLLEAL
ncbi:sulfite exporter TauE/SafE family protein [Aliiglaciecola sp. CAU 1673]|uniref:sulfite exporter TauE/SafE family protein n=1 Tax=Aliiglaciecola sp. CAU 1673 TaxID=3032595 RepID=UPI0023DB8446|nr:sulfite exporter TauE/SafE family protein [Aliiglaciecola sp. CAU 1673]MDF2180085.1 sulfite exporter TauE/SafE family protein [Aliiglaciecola sp. CAU 1673]